MKYSQIRSSKRRVLIAVIRNLKCFHGSPIRGYAGDPEVSRKGVRITVEYRNDSVPHSPKRFD